MKNASDDNGFNKTVQQDSFRRINNVCMQMMQQLCLSHDKQVRNSCVVFFFWPHCIVRNVITFLRFLMSNIQVHTQVKIVADAQLGAGATEARELEANWVILDRSASILFPN